MNILHTMNDMNFEIKHAIPSPSYRMESGVPPVTHEMDSKDLQELERSGHTLSSMSYNKEQA